MTKPQVKIVNCETGEEIVREMNDDEFAQYEADQAAEVVRQAEAEAKANAKAALLEQLGITEEQAKLLLS
jgi:hypothetical protein